MVYNILVRRRGYVLLDGFIVGMLFYRVNGLILVIDSFGFEMDLRINMLG